MNSCPNPSGDGPADFRRACYAILRHPFETPFRRALPVPERLFRQPIHLTHAGWESIPPKSPNYPLDDNPVNSFNYWEGRVLPEFCLAYVGTGSGVIETKRGTQKVAANQAFFYLPGEWHRHRPSAKRGWDLFWISGNGNLLHEWMGAGAFRLDGNRPQFDDPALFAAQFMRLLATAHEADFHNSCELTWQAVGLFSHFTVDSESAAERPASTDDLADRAIQLIWNHSHLNLSVPVVAAELGVGRRMIERAVKCATGRTVLEWIRHCRLERASCFLLEADLPLKQVAFRSGFHNQSHMRLAFQSHYGLPPDQFRHDRRK